MELFPHHGKLTEADVARIELESAQDQVNDFLDLSMEDFFHELVIPEMKSVAIAANLPQGFVDGIKFVKVGKSHGKIINTWGTKDKPFAKWFNYGTKDKIWIEPRDPDGVLAFPAKQGRNASAIFYQGNAKEGSTLFSKGHYITGLPRTEAMEIGLRLGMARLKIVSAERATQRFRSKSV